MTWALWALPLTAAALTRLWTAQQAVLWEVTARDRLTGILLFDLRVPAGSAEEARAKSGVEAFLAERREQIEARGIPFDRVEITIQALKPLTEEEARTWEQETRFVQPQMLSPTPLELPPHVAPSPEQPGAQPSPWAWVALGALALAVARRR